MSDDQLRSPWWEWENAEAVGIAERPDTRRLDKTPARELCLFCMSHHGYGTRGRFAKHSDNGERCRGSGLSRDTVAELLDAITKGFTVQEFVDRMKHRA
jgi:hypothetical protein